MSAVTEQSPINDAKSPSVGGSPEASRTLSEQRHAKSVNDEYTVVDVKTESQPSPQIPTTDGFCSRAFWLVKCCCRMCKQRAAFIWLCVPTKDLVKVQCTSAIFLLSVAFLFVIVWTPQSVSADVHFEFTQQIAISVLYGLLVLSAVIQGLWFRYTEYAHIVQYFSSAVGQLRDAHQKSKEFTLNGLKNLLDRTDESKSPRNIADEVRKLKAMMVNFKGTISGQESARHVIVPALNEIEKKCQLNGRRTNDPVEKALYADWEKIARDALDSIDPVVDDNMAKIARDGWKLTAKVLCDGFIRLSWVTFGYIIAVFSLEATLTAVLIAGVGAVILMWLDFLKEYFQIEFDQYHKQRSIDSAQGGPKRQ